MKLSDIQDRRDRVDAELRSIYDDAEKAGEDLAGEKLEKWNQLKAESDDLAGKEERAKVRDALDRNAAGKPLEQSGEEDATAWVLTPEQRMASYVARQSGQPEHRVSPGRAIRALITGDWRDAQLEQRTMATTTGTTGGFLLSSPLSASVIDLARNASVLVRAGVGTIPMDAGTLRVAKVASDPTAEWRGEGAVINESDGTFEAVTLHAYSLAALVRCNNELLDDAAGFASQLDTMLGAALGLEMDAAGLYGNGTGKPLGLRHTDGLQEQVMGASDGAAQADYDDLLDLLSDILTANGNPTTIIHSPRTMVKLAKLKTGISSDLTKLAPPDLYAAMTKLVSNQISVAETQGSSTDASTTFMGGFNNCAFGVRQSVTIEMSRHSSDVFTRNQTHVRAIMRGDFVTLRPSQLGRLIGIR